MKRAISGIVLLLFCIEFVTSVENHGSDEELPGFNGRRLLDKLGDKHSRNFYDKNEMEAKRKCEEFIALKNCLAQVTGSNIECLKFLNESYYNLYDMLRPGCGISKEMYRLDSTDLSLSRLATTQAPIYPIKRTLDSSVNLKKNFLKEFAYVLEQVANFYYLDVNKLNCHESPVKQVTACMDEYYSMAQDNLYSNLKNIRVPPKTELWTPAVSSKLGAASQTRFNLRSPAEPLSQINNSGYSLTAPSEKSEAGNYVQVEKDYLNENVTETRLPGDIESTTDAFYRDDFWNFTTLDKASQTETSTEETIKVKLTENTCGGIYKGCSASEEYSKSQKFSKAHPALYFPPMEFQPSFRYFVYPAVICLEKSSKGRFIVYRPPCGKWAGKDLSDKKITRELEDDLEDLYGIDKLFEIEELYRAEVLSTDLPQDVKIRKQESVLAIDSKDYRTPKKLNLKYMVESMAKQESINPKVRPKKMKQMLLPDLSINGRPVYTVMISVVTTMLVLLILTIVFKQWSEYNKKFKNQIGCNKCDLDFPDSLSKRNTRIDENDLAQIFSEAGLDEAISQTFIKGTNCVSCALNLLVCALKDKANALEGSTADQK